VWTDSPSKTPHRPDATAVDTSHTGSGEPLTLPIQGTAERAGSITEGAAPERATGNSLSALP